MKLILTVTPKEKVDDETSCNCDTCLVEDESIRLGGKNSIPLNVTNHDHMCQPSCIGNEFVTQTQFETLYLKIW